ncbi:MAG: tRNA 2-thiocytidine(32) synthetase TtcA [Lachnospiraceae bacterium]|nr:tRNA 2-thiocytidine(32) synthetase TtcA [Lachnospiraceae bacterium]
MKLQRLMSVARKAIDDYEMIQEGDKIAIGISGGKDSLALLYALHGLQQFYPKKFEVVAISVHLGYEDMDFTPVQELCDSLNVDFHLVRTDIGNIVFKMRKEDSPCSLCSKMRKGALNDKAKELGCNKVAYGHHKDDVVETMMLSLIYEGRFHSFAPVTYLDRMDLTLIRPLLYLKEADIIGFQHKYELPVVKNSCPVDGHTKREYVKNLLADMNMTAPGVKQRMFSAVSNGNLRGWSDKK